MSAAAQPFAKDAQGRPASQLAGAAWESVHWHKIPISRGELRYRIALWLRTSRGPSGVPFTADQAQLLLLLGGHLGQENAVKLEELARALDGLSRGQSRGRSDRYIKQLVHDLRVLHRVKVGSLRGYRRQAGGPQTSKVAGYFLCLTEREVLVTRGTRLKEALTTLIVCDAMTDGRYGLQRLIASTRAAAQGELNFGGKPHA